MKSGLNICIRECRMAEGVRTRSDAELATSNGYRLSSIGGSRPVSDDDGEVTSTAASWVQWAIGA
jgi:hypothetical protein